MSEKKSVSNLFVVVAVIYVTCLLLSNLIAGVTLVLERPFAIGDYVTLGEVEGEVEDISFRSFVLYEVNGDLVGSLCGRDGQLYGYSLLYWTQATTDEKRRCIEQMRGFVEQERMSERLSSL